MDQLESAHIDQYEKSSSLTRDEIKTFTISALGGSLEFYDFVVYVFFAQIIAQLFFDSSTPIGGLLLSFTVFASGYLARVFGGIIFSHYGDKSGRKNSFALTVFLMAAPTFLIGVLPTFSQIGIAATLLLIACRIAQGLAIGGEIPCSITFIYEHAHKSRRGLACGVLFCGIILGIFLGSSVGALLSHYLTKEQLYSWGWRLPFLAGGVLGLIGVYLRRFLKETPVYKKMKKENIKLPVGIVVSQYKFELFQTGTSIWALAVAVTLYLLYLPTYLSVYHGFESGDILFINSAAVFFYAVIIILFGILSDRIGPRKVLNFGLILLIAFSYPIFNNFSANNFNSIYFCYAIVSVATASITAGSIYILAQSFPAKIRYSGASLSYNLAFGIFGGFTPLIATTLIKQTNLNTSPAFYMIGVSLFALCFSFMKSGKTFAHSD
ncbi:MFS transporter [Fluviispira multicolorata]|uniref:MFS transporter n=1 Tax=Fluviispira multicolorata TaxID=2654512 RepID=A0A833N5V2_9BACT|nr:MFS transporter [Fluviispira multicolorata]KAB8033804.1 MFS transporter [Fluviispira multicolorata]